MKQLSETIENLEQFIAQVSGDELKQRQSILLNAGIMEVILQLLKLIHSKIFIHCEIDSLSRNDTHIVSEELKAIPEKSP